MALFLTVIASKAGAKKKSASKATTIVKPVIKPKLTVLCISAIRRIQKAPARMRVVNNMALPVVRIVWLTA